MSNDPQWMLDEKLSAAQLWEKRAREQAVRAEAAEERATKAEKALADAEWNAPKAIGKTPEEAVRALAKAKGWGKVVMGDTLESDPPYTWGFRFSAGGTSFKAAGCEIPGGYALTWWK